MIHQKAASETSEVSPVFRGFTCWKHPFRNINIYIQSPSVSLISERALTALKADPASEVGGLLLGRFEEQSGSTAIVITEPEFIVPDAPLFNSTGSDLRSLIAAAETERSGTTVIGYFRSHVRDGLCLSDQDRELIERSIHDPQSVFLVIHPFEMGICMAGFFFWEDGEVQTESSEMEVPFIANRGEAEGALPQEEHDLRAPSEVPRVAAPDTEVAETGFFPQEADNAEESSPPAFAANLEVPPSLLRSLELAPEPPRHLLKRVILVSTLLLFFGSAAYLGISKLNLQPWLNGHGQRASGALDLGLKVDRPPGGGLNVSWNRNLPDFARMSSAKLSIVDGTVHRQLDLDRDQLQSGKVTYFPATGAVQFRLEAYLGSDHRVSQWVRVLTPKSGSGRHGATRTPESPDALQAPRLPLADRIASSAQPKTEKKNNVARRDSNVPLSTAKLDTKPARSTTAEFATMMAQAKAPAQDAGRAASLPRPVRQVIPNVKRFGYSLDGESRVKVEVKIDETGRVSDAYAVDSGSSGNGFLIVQSLDAARQWVFEPAKIHGKNVPGGYLIEFRFRKPD